MNDAQKDEIIQCLPQHPAPVPPLKKPKETRIFGITLNRLHIYIVRTVKTVRTFEDLRRKKGIRSHFVHLEKIGFIQDGHNMVFGWNGNFEWINPIHWLFFRILGRNLSQFVHSITHNLNFILDPIGLLDPKLTDFFYNYIDVSQCFFKWVMPKI